MNPQIRAQPGQPLKASDVLGHAIPTPRVPTLPTLIRPLPEKPLQCDRLEDLARHVHGLRGARGLRIGRLSQASYGGSDTFPGFSLWAIDPDTTGEVYLGFAAVQSERDDALRGAIERTQAERKAA